MRKIKLCFISFLAYPLFNEKANVVFGGAEIDAYNLARNLEKSGKYDITFYVGDYGQEYEEKYGEIKVRKFKYMNLSAYKGFAAKLRRQLSIIAEVFRFDCDVCFIEAYNEMLGWVALIPGNLKGSKTIFRLAHDLDTDPEDAKKRGFLFNNLYRYGIGKAGAIISQTEIQKKLLLDRFGLDSRIIKNAFFINDKIDPEDKKFILWVARAQNWKRPRLFLQLVERLPEENFMMIMPGENELQEEIRKEAARYPNLKFIDYVPFAQVQQYYNAAKLFVNTSEYEGFPNAFVQACLGRTPILSFNVNPDAFIETNGLGFFCNNDLEQAVRFIREYTQEQMRTLGDNAMSYVKKHHDISGSGPIYEEIIRGLAAGREAG